MDREQIIKNIGETIARHRGVDYSDHLEDMIAVLLEPDEYFEIEERVYETGKYRGSSYIGGKKKGDKCVGKTIHYFKERKNDYYYNDLGD